MKFWIPAPQPAAALVRIKRRMKELWETVPTRADPGSYYLGRSTGTADTLRAIQEEIDRAADQQPAPQPDDALSKLADDLEEASTVLDEQFHRDAICNVMLRAARALRQATPQPSVTPADEYESVGWQYKFPSLWGGVVWRDSPNDHNGSRCTEAREIFAKRAADQQTDDSALDYGEEWAMNVAGVWVKLDEWQPGAVKRKAAHQQADVP